MQSIPDRSNAQDTTSDPSSPLATTLDPADWTALRTQAHRMLDDMLVYTDGIREYPVWQPIPAEVRTHFQQPLPSQPAPLEQVHQEFMHSILPYTARNGHPGFLGWVQGGGTPVGMLAEMLAAGLNANLGGRDQVPLDVERQVTEWMRHLFGFPQSASGLFVTGTSAANLLAVKVARDASLGCDVRRQGVRQSTQNLVAYASTAVHGCVARAFDLLGLGSDALRLVPVDLRHRMDLTALAAMVQADRDTGFTPFLVVGTAGTVDTGAIDDLAGLAAFCAAQQLWFHVDGAYGALGMLSPEVAAKLTGIEQADSLAFDFHKWAQVPYDAGFLLMRDGDLHHASFASSCSYLSRDERGMAAGSPWPCDFGPDLSRGFRALKTWATLKVYGTDALGAVIGRTCELARYLEVRIDRSPELELLAPVELNIVCFRYRFGVSGESAAQENENHLNRQIVVSLQEAGAVAPSTTLIDGQLAIRAAIVNHRTTRVEMDTLVEAVLAAGRLLRPKPSALTRVEPKWQQRVATLQQVEAKLAAKQKLPKATEVALRYARAMLLMQLGQTLAARSEHLRVVQLDPTHELNLNALGLLLAANGNRKAALITLAEAVKHHPESKVSRVNLGSVLLEEKDPATARTHFEAALRIDPDFRQAHAGLYYALAHLGDPEAAEPHHRLGFAQTHIFKNLYRGRGKPIPVLLLVSSTGGNTPIEKLIDDTVFETHVVVADFFDAKNRLPDHRLVINGIGDAEVSQAGLLASESILKQTAAPVLNPPTAVLVTGRCQNAARLRSLPGVVAPLTLMFPYGALAGTGGAEVLFQHGFNFPILLRVPGFHMGEHFIQVDSPAAVSSAISQLPGEGRADSQLLAIEYLDARAADGSFRKYRVMMIDGQLYPLHLAISPQWKIHYFSADMADHPDHQQEERAFLADMHIVLGPKAIAALRRLQSTLGLDYAGVDFGIDRQGNVLLFEANATMIVPHPDPGEQWDYRRPAVNRIHVAVHQMLLRRAGVPAHNVAGSPAPNRQLQSDVPHHHHAPEAFQRRAHHSAGAGEALPYACISDPQESRHEHNAANCRRGDRGREIQTPPRAPHPTR